MGGGVEPFYGVNGVKEQRKFWRHRFCHRSFSRRLKTLMFKIKMLIDYEIKHFTVNRVVSAFLVHCGKIWTLAVNYCELSWVMCSLRWRQASQAFVLHKQTRSVCAQSDTLQNVGFFRYKNSTCSVLSRQRWCYTGRFATTIFLRNTAL